MNVIYMNTLIRCAQMSWIWETENWFSKGIKSSGLQKLKPNNQSDLTVIELVNARLIPVGSSNECLKTITKLLDDSKRNPSKNLDRHGKHFGAWAHIHLQDVQYWFCFWCFLGVSSSLECFSFVEFQFQICLFLSINESLK